MRHHVLHKLSAFAALLFFIASKANAALLDVFDSIQPIRIKKKKNILPQNMSELRNIGHSDEEIYAQIPFQPLDVVYLPYDESIELDFTRLRKSTTCIGEGHFGEVWLGSLLNASGHIEETVAIKMPRRFGMTADELKTERQCIRNELKILAYVGKHANVLELKGAVTLMKDRFWMALEYCDLGSLEKFLADKKKNKLFIDEIVKQADNLSATKYKAQLEIEWIADFENRRAGGFITSSDLLFFGLQIANGMDFLHGKGIVHCDLALRNILLDVNYTVKIADFGLSRQTRNGYYRYSCFSKQQQAIPLFWTAPEVLKNSKVMLESDWWTFGVLLWELFELSGRPYANISNGSALLDFLESGQRMAMPQYSPQEIYQLMLSLWNMEPQNRPSLNACLQIILKQLELSCSVLFSQYLSLKRADSPDLPPLNPLYFQREAVVLPKKNFSKRTGTTFCRRPTFTIFLMAGAILIIMAACISAFLILKISANNKSTEYVPIGNETYDCVNGNIAEVLLDGKFHPMVDLNLPEKQPTLINGNLEYLFVPNLAEWWYGLKYCTGWCGYLVSIKGKEENQLILEMVKKHQSNSFSNFWIGLKGWKGHWYLDDESNVNYFNFLNQTEADEDLTTDLEKRRGCVQADRNGIWSLSNCDAMLPFVCERNTSDDNIRRTQFHPHQEEKCQNIGGTCKYAADCFDGYTEKRKCPLQTSDILCCVPKIQKPLRVINATATTCTEAGGICNHVDADQCRDGQVLFNLSSSCPDTPRKYDCCLKNHDI